MPGNVALAFLSLGSNIEPEIHLPAAVHALRRLGAIVDVSPAVESPAWGSAPQPPYVNAAVLLRTELPPIELRARLRSIEHALGRIRTADKNAPRGIDIDVCLYDSMVMADSALTLPDPAILERPYLSRTLAALSPAFVHPVTGESLQEIARRSAGGMKLPVHRPLTAALRQAAGLEPAPAGHKRTEPEDQR